MLATALALAATPAHAQEACAATHAKVGQVADLRRIMHQVGGTATIVDDCTVEIRDFTYDGRGIDVRIYGATDGRFSRGFAMTDDLVRRKPYTGDTLIARLPAGKTWDDVDSLSVWCVDFNVDFGSGVFRKP